MGDRTATTHDAFRDFVTAHEPALRRALVATYGTVVGREAALDSLSWAWEHWERVVGLDNPVGYLYRVGQTAAGRLLRAGPSAVPAVVASEQPEVTPELEPALMRLSEQQRAVVVLVHGYGISQREVAAILGLGVSTVREHLARAMAKLRADLSPADPAPPDVLPEAAPHGTTREGGARWMPT